jgi:hypothetical protein
VKWLDEYSVGLAVMVAKSTSVTVLVITYELYNQRQRLLLNVRKLTVPLYI